MKIKNALTFAAVVCGLLVSLAAAPESVRAQAGATPPAGSYQQTCKNFKVYFNHVLDATCRTKSGAQKESRIRFDFLCAGDISNQNGVLTCAKTADSAQFKQAVNAFSAASIIILGREPKSVGIEEAPPGNYKVQDSELLMWLADLFAAGNGQQYLDGIKFVQAVEVVKTRAAQQPVQRGELIRNAYQNVFKRDPTTDEYQKWDESVRAKKNWYATIVGTLKSGK